MRQRLARFFRLEANGTTFRREIVGGTSTFLAMSYIIFVQPGILSQAGMDFSAVMVATCLAAALATFLMGLLANYPVAVAPGMGENFFFVFVLCGAAPLGFGLTWQQALAAVCLAGIVFVLLTLSGLLTRVVDSIPASLKCGIAAGIGLFIAVIGLEFGNLIVSNPVTLVQMGNLREPVTLVSALGLLVMIVLLALRVRGAIALGILATTGLAAAFGLVRYHGLFSADFSLAPTLLKMDFAGLFRAPLANVATALFVLFYLGLFDTVGNPCGSRSTGGVAARRQTSRGRAALCFPRPPARQRPAVSARRR